MHTRFRRSTVVISAAVAAVLVSSGVAFAYWTTSGSGTATAGVGTSGNVTVTQTTTPSGLFPGGAAQTIGFRVDNTTPGPLYVTNVTVAIASIKDSGGSVIVGCDNTDFTLVQPVWTPVTLAATVGTASGTASIQMVNKVAANQDPCKNATVNLAFSAV